MMTLAASMAGCFAIGVAASFVGFEIISRRHKMRDAARVAWAAIIGVIGLLTAWGYSTVTSGLTDAQTVPCFLAMLAGIGPVFWRHRRSTKQ